MYLTFSMRTVSKFVMILLLCSACVAIFNTEVIKADSYSLVTVEDEHFIIHQVLGGFSNFFVGSFNASDGYWIELDLSCQSTDNGAFIVYVDILSAHHGSIFSAKGTKFSQTVYLDYEDVYNITIAKSPFYSSVRLTGIIDVFHKERTGQASSENWVKVATLTGSGGIGSTNSFTVDLVDWRIIWEIEPGDGSERTAFMAYIFPNVGVNGGEHWFEKIEHFGIEETTGVVNIYNRSGSFYMDVLTGNVDRYTMIIEQNTDSIPEFPSWTLLPLFLTATFSAIGLKKSLLHPRK
jgi:hypothetical protein